MRSIVSLKVMEPPLTPCSPLEGRHAENVGIKPVQMGFPSKPFLGTDLLTFPPLSALHPKTLGSDNCRSGGGTGRFTAESIKRLHLDRPPEEPTIVQLYMNSASHLPLRPAGQKYFLFCIDLFLSSKLPRWGCVLKE